MQKSVIDTTQLSAIGNSYTILPDSSISLLVKFTGLVFNKKISEQDLPIEYLKIETAKDTFLEKNRAEIIRLIRDPRLKNQIADKSFAMDNNRNVEAILVR